MIGLLEIRRRKVQFALIALVVTLISYLVLMINGLGVGLNDQAGSALRNFDADAIAYADGAGLSVIRSELSADALEAAMNHQGVEEAAPLGYVAANYSYGDREVASAAFIGYDPGTIGEPNVTSGRALTETDTRGLLGDSDFLRRAGLEVGDTVTISLRLETFEFEVVGEINQGNFFFQPVVYVLRDTWREMKYGEASASGSAPEASIVLLKGDDLLGVFDSYEVVDKSTAFANIEGVAGQQSTVVALRVFGYIIGALVIGVFFYVLTLQKVAQIGVLKAVGASTFFVFRQVLVQAVAVSIIGLIVSVPLAWFTDYSLKQLPDPVPIAFTLNTYVTTISALLVTAIVGAFFSGRQVVKVDPIIALGQQQ
jgi:putative ABC transport system permease protein